MKVARFALMVSFLLFLSTAVFSQAKASEAKSLYLRGVVPQTFTMGFVKKRDRYYLKKSQNFHFYGNIWANGVRVKKSIFALKGKKKSYNLVTVAIN